MKKTCRIRCLRLLAALAALPASAQKKVTFGHQQVFDLAPILLAQDKGFFAKHGIEVVLKPIPLNSQNPAALEAGEVDIAMPTASVLLQAVNGGLDIVAVVRLYRDRQDRHQFRHRGAAGIQHQDAGRFRRQEGRRAGAECIPACHVPRMAHHEGRRLEEGRVRRDPVFPQMEGILKSGSVDAVVAIQPFMARIIGTKTGELMSNFIRDMPAGMSITVFASKKAWADKNQDAIKAYRAGFDEGCGLCARPSGRGARRRSPSF